LCWNLRLVIELWYLEGFWVFFLRGFFEDFYFCMVKYLSFHNSSFALRYILLKCKWQGHSVTHPLFELRSIASYYQVRSVITGKSVGQLWFPPPPMFCCELLVCERLHQKMGWNVQNGGWWCNLPYKCDDTHLQILPPVYAATSTNHGFWVHATFRMGDEREDS
jgi:hypothetical protein